MCRTSCPRSVLRGALVGSTLFGCLGLLPVPAPFVTPIPTVFVARKYITTDVKILNTESNLNVICLR
jgi:hypothetical protein